MKSGVRIQKSGVRSQDPIAKSPCPDPEDLGRIEFLRALDAADFELDEWLVGTHREPGFLPNMLDRIDRWKPFTPAMRVQIDKLMNRYMGRVKWEGRPAAAPVRSQTREAAPKRELF